MATSKMKRSAYFTPVELDILMHSYSEFEAAFRKKSNTAAAAKNESRRGRRLLLESLCKFKFILYIYAITIILGNRCKQKKYHLVAIPPVRKEHGSSLRLNIKTSFKQVRFQHNSRCASF